MARAPTLFALLSLCVSCGEEKSNDAKSSVGSNKAQGKQTWACVLSDEAGKTVQCFEKTDDLPKAKHEQMCNEYEAAKRSLAEGSCPKEGRSGVCDYGDRKTACYGESSGCEKRCTDPGKFTKD